MLILLAALAAAARRVRAERIIAVTCVAIVLTAVQGNAHKLRAAEPAKATTAKTAREEAIRSIPLDKFDADTRAKVNAVISNPSLYRRLPLNTTDCDPELYLFLLRHPDVVVNIWEVLGVTKMTLTPTGPNTYQCTDGEGTTGNVTYLHRSGDLHVLYSEGSYEGPLLPKAVRGRCVMVMRTSQTRDANGRTQVNSRLDAFLRVDNLGAEIIAKTLQPIVGKAADFNFVETNNFVGGLSKHAENNPEACERLGDKLTKVDASVRQRFVELCTAVSEKKAQAVVPASNSGPVVKRDSGRR